MKYRSLLILIILIFNFTEAKAPQLTPKDVVGKVEEILKAHACHKCLTTELMERALQNFVDELDPTKTYFIESEIAAWLEPTKEVLQKTISGYKNKEFSVFQEIYTQFLTTIARRNLLEQEISSLDLPKGVKSEEFKDLAWAASEQDLKERLLRIKALQLDATEKLGEDSRNKFVQRMEKRRLNRESELLESNLGERNKIILSYTLKAVTSALDSHTNYFTPTEAGQFMIQVQQRLFGIGAQLRDDLDGLTVTRIIENSPAFLSNKLKINDKIIAVDSEPVIGMEITEAVELIRGKQGTKVHLTVLRDSGEDEERQSEKLEIELIRNEVVLEESRLDTQVEAFGDGCIATLKLFSFYQDPNTSSAQDIRKEIEEIKAKSKLNGVILDLRSNAGGLLTQAVSVTGLFINKGIVVSIKDHTGKLQHLREIEGDPVWDGPLCVLVNKASASAAEIVAQTLQDYGRAIILGDAHTFGKGTFQTFTLDPSNEGKVNPQGEYKVTRGRYYTVSGKSPQLTGVLSDIEIPGLLSKLDIGESFAKFPLENDQIDPHFEDDLSDISPFHRIQLAGSYKQNLQPRLSTYVPYIERLCQNSENRLKENKHYQSFLNEIEKQNFDSEPVELFSQTDPQLVEAINVMKDLIFLSCAKLNKTP